MAADDQDMEPTLADIHAARDLLRDHLPPTPMWSYPLLDRAAGATVLVKHENTQPVGAFKVRGGVTLLAGMSDIERERGTVTWSTGNHAQSLAYASHVFGAACTVVMPAGTPGTKARAVEGWGAQAIRHGDSLEAAERHAREHAERSGARLISPGDTPELLAGVGTVYLEIVEARPDLDAIVVPVGSGTGAASACLVAGCPVIAVQSAASPAAHDSWRAGELVTRPNGTAAAGLATGRGFALPQRIMRDRLADFLLVGDDEITHARRLLATTAHTLAEGAGAAALAGVLSRPDLFNGKRVAIVCTGGNADADELATLRRG
ncbi:serine/threonine dehydratase [Actinoplanes philippinensis]|uniref:threonine ammonia-lyase n=2 Tax=Actinoplanes philippinensis TaxID=35752 RepID=A0A1I2JPE2_9ACTN|nr:serine/threonine dehydratase [Actinoplanes philippinensis]SFF56454.1 threonine dehydratase [Actinoplanes philippinensis]